MANVATGPIQDYFFHRTSGQRQNGRTAGHRFEHHQAKWFIPLNRKQHRQGVPQQFVLGCNIGRANEFNRLAVNMGLDLLLEIVTEQGLNLARDFQGNTSPFCNLNRQMSSLDWGDASEKTQIVLLLATQLIDRHIYSVMDGLNVRHLFHSPLEIADGNEIYFRKVLIERTQSFQVRMVNRVHEPRIYETGARQPRHIVDVN